MPLASMVAAKIKELDLSVSGAANKLGVAAPAFAAVAAGKSLPNARTFKKYAKFLGVSADKVAEMVAAEKGSAPKAKRGGRRPGRPPGSGRGRRSAGIDGTAKSLHAIAETVAKVEGILGDQLAVRVHTLGTAQRRMIEAMLNGIG